VTEHRLGPEDAGRTVAAAAGDRLVVSLPENASTGYTWRVDELPPGTRVVEERFDLPASGAIGSSSHHVFVLEPAGEQGTLRLQQTRPWQPDEVLDRYEVTLARLRT
jgi:inhibitor of cysteine peptidase